MHQIRYFLALYAEGSFTRAARRCDVSQPTVTNSLRRLERELGARLFERKPRMQPTELGRTIWPYMQEIVAQAGHVREAADACAPRLEPRRG